jgi:hypothetical protein
MLLAQLLVSYFNPSNRQKPVNGLSILTLSCTGRHEIHRGGRRIIVPAYAHVNGHPDPNAPVLWLYNDAAEDTHVLSHLARHAVWGRHTGST